MNSRWNIYKQQHISRTHIRFASSTSSSSSSIPSSAISSFNTLARRAESWKEREILMQNYILFFCVSLGTAMRFSPSPQSKKSYDNIISPYILNYFLEEAVSLLFHDSHHVSYIVGYFLLFIFFKKKILLILLTFYYY